MIPIHEIEKAIEYDLTLKFTPGQKDALKKKYLASQTYSQKKLFENMFSGKTIVFKDYPIRLKKRSGVSTRDTLIEMLKNGLPKKEKIYIRSGPARNLYRVTIDETIKRFLRGKSRFGVTDLHFRGTKFYKNIDAESISYFNLLPHCPYDVSALEMLTLVISSKGIFTDSHSDDGDGSNHCFSGKKLWLAWDRTEGKKKGLEDCTHDEVLDQAHFTMSKFLSLKSAHWFLVRDNETLFMPGNFTHKVVTLESYIGFGSFYVSMPNYIKTIKRWQINETTDVKGNFIPVMNKAAMKKIKEISTASPKVKKQWGFDYLIKGTKKWDNGLSESDKKILSGNNEIGKLVSLMKNL